MDVITQYDEETQMSTVIGYAIGRDGPERYGRALTAEWMLQERDGSDSAFWSYWDRKGKDEPPKFGWSRSPKRPGEKFRYLLQFGNGDQVLFQEHQGYGQRLLRGLHLLETSKGPIPPRHLYTAPPGRLRVDPILSTIPYLYKTLGCTSVWWT